MTRVLFCTGRVTYGGVEKLRLSLQRRLSPERYQHHIICNQGSGPIFDGLRSTGAEITEVGPFTSVLNPRRFRVGLEVVRRWRPDIIHGAVIEGYTVGGVLSLLTGVPSILEETSYPTFRSWRGNLVTRLMADIATECIAVAPATATYLTQRLRIPARKVTVIPNAVETPPPHDDEALRALRIRYGIEHDALVIGSVG